MYMCVYKYVCVYTVAHIYVCGCVSVRVGGACISAHTQTQLSILLN